MVSYLPKDLSTGKLHGYLLTAVAPRPIAFASTIDSEGNPNLSPFRKLLQPQTKGQDNFFYKILHLVDLKFAIAISRSYNVT